MPNNFELAAIMKAAKAKAKGRTRGEILDLIDQAQGQAKIDLTNELLGTSTVLNTQPQPMVIQNLADLPPEQQRKALDERAAQAKLAKAKHILSFLPKR